MHRHILFCLFIFIGLSVNAQTIYLHGNVTNQAGKPIANATVTIMRLGLTYTTDEVGAYSFSCNTAIKKVSALPSETERIAMNRGVLEIGLSHPSLVYVDIFNAKGILLEKKTSSNAGTGVYRLDISKIRRGSNVLFIRASAGNRRATFLYLPSDKGNSIANSGIGNNLPVGGKTAKMAVAIDTLKATAPGYFTNTKVISSYEERVDISLDTISKIQGNWRLERAICASQYRDSCSVGLQPCPSFYCFSGNRLTIYETSYSVTVTIDNPNCDTTIYCYDTLKYDFFSLDDTTYRCWGDTIKIGLKNDTLAFKRETTQWKPGSSTTYFFVKETQPVPYCSRGCIKGPWLSKLIFPERVFEQE
jgi:hypothetical protein